VPILNYTTRIAADRSIAQIQKLLAMHGANEILAQYDDTGSITALSFSMKLDGRLVGFRLPCDWRPILSILENDRKVPKAKKTQEHALCVAWRIVKDWTEAQMAILETKMVKLDQIFLPYAIVADGRSLYEAAKTSNLLGSSSPQ
jgi:hypothetical protein